MGLELHIWGPAFGLPSIDAECNAAVALLKHAFHGRDAAWELIPNHDTSLSPSGSFPLLVDGDHRVAGFTPILKHLQSNHIHLNIRTIDNDLPATSRATATALASFLATAALPLVDLSLYCTYQNYYNATLPAYTPLLPWHTNYACPPARREEARVRTAQLGLESLDVETLYDDMDKYTAQGASISGQFEAKKRAAEEGRRQPALLPFGRRLLGGVQHGDRFKLQQITARCFEPLDAMLGPKTWLLEGQLPSSADYLAWGYLGLMLFPECPQRWLHDALQRWPRLVEYTNRMRDEFLGGQNVDARAVMRGQQRQDRDDQLPWRLPTRPSLPATVTTIGREIAQSVPLPSQMAYLDTRAPATSTAGIITRLFALSSVAFTVLLGVGYHFASQTVPTWDYEFRASDFATADDKEPFTATTTTRTNASDALAELQRALRPEMDLDPGQGRERERLGGGIVGEVQVDVE